MNTDWTQFIHQFVQQFVQQLGQQVWASVDVQGASGMTGPTGSTVPTGDTVAQTVSQLGHTAGELPQFVVLIVTLGIVSIILGIFLCVYRLYRGPHLADRVLAADTLSLHVAALVILLAIQLETAIFFDAVLVVAIVGFASSLAFAQYIGSQRQDRSKDIDHGDGSQNATPDTQAPDKVPEVKT